MAKKKQFTPAALLDVYKMVIKITVVDEGIRRLIMSGTIHPVYHPPTGQEIVAAGMGAHLETTDYLVTIYRGLHDQIAKGMPLKPLVAEYFMKATGACKGKGGAMHLTHPESGVMVTTGVVGSSMPIALGLAWASQLRGDGRVTVASFGDGAANIGAFHESMNMAALWKLPLVFLCQNNGYAESTSYEDGTSSATIGERAAAYGPNMVGVCVNGDDAKTMWQTMSDAVTRARAGEGPTLLEANTFRFSGHYFGDSSPYIPEEEMAAEKAKDHLGRLRRQVLESGASKETELVAIKKQFEEEFREAVEFAKASPEPNPDELHKDIYGATENG